MTDPHSCLNRRSVKWQAGLLAAGLMLAGSAASAYPEFQSFTEKSGRTTDCTMCHVHPNGPTGDQRGQVGALSDAELERLNKARAALEPGQDVDSPILNEFGNHIMKELGKKKVLELKAAPEKLVDALGEKSDLDGDGIADSLEYRDGTHPLNRHHGDPLKLFVNNFVRFRTDIILAVVGVGLIVFGLANFVAGLGVIYSRRAR